MPAIHFAFSPTLDSIPRCSVIVSTYNEGHLVIDAVDSLLVQTENDLEIIVVDDGSVDDTTAILAAYKTHSKVKVITLSENQGVPAARNFGIKAARGDIIAFMDADATATEHWIKTLVQPFAQARVGCAGGPDAAPASDSLFALCVDFTLQSIIATGGLRRNSRLATYSPAGCNMAIRASILEQTGLFDERLNKRGEEKELMQRIRRQGSDIVYVPDALVWHHRRPSIVSFWKQIYLSGRARVDILRLAPDALELAHLFPAVLTMLLFASALSALLRPSEPLLALPLAIYCLLIIGSGILAAFRLRSVLGAWYVTLTSAIVHLGYGLGFWKRLAELALHRIIKKPEAL